MRFIPIISVSTAICLMAASSMNIAAASSTWPTNMTGQNAATVSVTLSSAASKDMAGELNSKKMVGPRIDIAKPDLPKQVATVHDALKNTKLFSEMALPELNKLNNSFQVLTQSQNQISEAQKSNKAPDEAWFREQQIINAILDKAEADSRLICITEKLTGSHRSKRVCRTSAEVARLEEKSKNSWQRRGENLLDAPRTGNQ